MNCNYSIDRLALYVEGDLPAGDIAEIDRHVSGCATCGAFVGELRESQSLFKSLRQETVASSALAEVRENVLRRTAVQPSMWFLKLERALFGFRVTRSRVWHWRSLFLA